MAVYFRLKTLACSWGHHRPCSRPFASLLKKFNTIRGLNPAFSSIDFTNSVIEPFVLLKIAESWGLHTIINAMTTRHLHRCVYPKSSPRIKIKTATAPSHLSAPSHPLGIIDTSHMWNFRVHVLPPHHARPELTAHHRARQRNL